MKGGTRRRAAQLLAFLVAAMVLTPGAVADVDGNSPISTFAGAITYQGSEVRDFDILNAPRRILVEHTNANNRIVVESGGHRIRRLTPTSISTIAGVTGLRGFAGDGGPAILARFAEPSDAVYDSAGNLYVADTSNHRIRKIDGVTGIITTVAGTGTNGFNGDGLPATQTSFSYPMGLALDANGNMYIADRQNHRIRKIDGVTGLVSTVAGTGKYLHCGDPQYPNGATWQPIGDGGLATEACISHPWSIILRDNDLYVADTNNHRVRRVSLVFGTIETVAGSGCKRQYEQWFLLAPQPAVGSVTMTTSDFADRPCSFEGSPRAFTGSPNQCHASTGPESNATCVSGQNLPTQYLDPGGPGDGVAATAANLSFPHDLRFDSSGNLYIAETTGGPHSSACPQNAPSSGPSQICAGNRVRKIDVSTNIASTFAGDGTISSTFNIGDGGPATSAKLNQPQGLLTLGNTIEIAELGNAGPVPTSGCGSTPTNPCIDGRSGKVRRVDAGGTISTIMGTRNLIGCCIDDGLPVSFAFVQNVRGIAVSSSGDTYLSDSDHHRIIRVHPSGVITTVAGNGVNPAFVTSAVNDGGPATDGLLSYPRGVAVDSAGNLYIADMLNNRVRKVSTNGTISTVAGACSPSTFGCAQEGSLPADGDGASATSAWLKWPTDVTVDSAGNLYIAEPYMQRIRKVDISGLISTFAGSGYICPRFSYNGYEYDPPVTPQSCGRMYPLGNGAYLGDKLPTQDSPYDYGKATEAKLNFPMGVAVDSSGNVFIADTANHKIRKVDPDGWITSVAGSGVFGFAFLPNQITSQPQYPTSTLGDGGPATLASLGYPHDVHVDGAGNLFIADTYNARVRRVNPGGIITTVAGNGCHPGWGSCPHGDGGVATRASLRWPVASAFKGTNLLIAEAEAENFTSDQLTSFMASTFPGQFFTNCRTATQPFMDQARPGQSYNCTSHSTLVFLGYESLDGRNATNNRVRLVAGS